MRRASAALQTALGNFHNPLTDPEHREPGTA